MLKTNDAKVKKAVQKYLLDCSRDGLEGCYYELCTKHQIKCWPIMTVDNIFRSEKSEEINRIGRRRAFIDWLQGLCSALPVYDGYYHINRGRLAKFLKLTKAEALKYPDEKVNALILHLYYREFESLLRKEQRKILQGKNDVFGLPL